MRQFTRGTLLGIGLTLALAASAAAQVTVRISDAAIQPGEEFALDVTMENDVYVGGWQMVFRWSSDVIRCDSVVVDSNSFDARFYTDVAPIDYAGRVTILALLPPFTFPLPEIPPGDHSMGRLYFSSQSGSFNQNVFVDSAIVELVPGFYLQSNLSTPDGLLLYPVIIPGVITIGNPGPVVIAVSPSELSFRGEFGGFDPDAQILNITSPSGVDFNWTAQWSGNWLDVLPSLGKTPALPSVAASVFALPIGAYADTIWISSPLAVNSPVPVPVTLEVDSAAPPPPPSGFALMQNRPNPFVTYHDPDTEIRFSLEQTDNVSIVIYDMLAQRIRTLYSRSGLSANDYVARWDGRNDHGQQVASGHYFYRMVTSRGSVTKRMTVIK